MISFFAVVFSLRTAAALRERACDAFLAAAEVRRTEGPPGNGDDRDKKRTPNGVHFLS